MNRHKSLLSLSVLSLLLGSLPLQAQSPTALIVDPIITLAEAKYKGRIGLSIQRLDNDSLLYAHRHREVFIPASVTKVLSTGAALALRGPSYRFGTKIYYTGSIQDSILNGNIIVRGDGDPSIGTSYISGERERFLRELSSALQAHNIKVITGGVYYDASLPTGLGQVSGWLPEDKRAHYGAGLFGLNFADNVFSFTVSTGRGEKLYKVSTEPASLGLSWSFRDTKSSKNGIRVGDMQMGRREVILQGNPRRVQTQSYRMPNPSPADALAQYVALGLDAQGIVVRGERASVSYEGYQDEGELLYTYQSKTLDTLARITNYRSQNFYAEAIGRLVDPSRDKGVAITDYWLKMLNIPKEELRLYDASGLDRRNRISPRLFDRALRKLFGGYVPLDGVLLETLPEVGKEGTVRRLMPYQDKTKIYLKSGTLRGVSTYVGYVYDGHYWYSIAYLTNGLPSATVARSILQRIVYAVWQIEDKVVSLQ